MARRPSTIPAILNDQRGLATVEYVIALCLVAALGVSLWDTFGHMLANRLGGASTRIGDTTRLQSSKGVPGAGD